MQDQCSASSEASTMLFSMSSIACTTAASRVCHNSRYALLGGELGILLNTVAFNVFIVTVNRSTVESRAVRPPQHSCYLGAACVAEEPLARWLPIGSVGATHTIAHSA